MTKAELITEIAIQQGYDKVTISNIVEAAMLNVKKSLAAGENVYLRGFGTFFCKHRAKKVARDISKKTTVIVPEHNIPGFRPANEFKGMVR